MEKKLANLRNTDSVTTKVHGRQKLNMNKFTIIEDTRQQTKRHVAKNKYFESLGINVLRSKLPCGDYALMTNMSTVVDTKKDMQEICGNLCSSQHERFVRECELARENGIKLIVLVENTDGITCIDDVFKWYNPRLKLKYKGQLKYPRATTGVTLAKTMISMEKNHGVEFRFCKPSESGRKVIEILEGPERIE